MAGAVVVLSTRVIAQVADPAGPPSGTGSSLAVVEVWIELSEPALVTLPRDATAQRSALRERILMQQENVMKELRALGAVESGRLQQTRNALAIRIPASALEAVKKIDGVIAVRSVSHRNRIDD